MIINSREISRHTDWETLTYGLHYLGASDFYDFFLSYNSMIKHKLNIIKKKKSAEKMRNEILLQLYGRQ
jgi:hypothetical protein